MPLFVDTDSPFLAVYNKVPYMITVIIDIIYSTSVHFITKLNIIRTAGLIIHHSITMIIPIASNYDI